MELGWYPMLRDSIYYTIVLVVLAIFFGVNTPQQIDWYEAVVLFSMYWIYILIMYKNEAIGSFMTRLCSRQVALASSLGKEEGAAAKVEIPLRRQSSFNNPGQFREGILKLLTKNTSILDTTGINLVSKISLTVEEAFRKYDKDNSGSIDKSELALLLSDLGCEVSDASIEELFKTLDSDNNGSIDLAEFSVWYTGSKERLRAAVITQFKKFDAEKGEAFEPIAVKKLLESLGGNYTDEQVGHAIRDMQALNEKGGGITLDVFLKWFETSTLFETMSEAAGALQEAAEGISLSPPSPATFFTMAWYIFTIPQVVCFWVTIPDVRLPGRAKWAYVAFFVCLAWMGLICYFMVSWIETIGATIGIPSVIMGLTFVAAGTSVPDMLSAIIVAKQGEADQAVASSIGSNVFDICIGLALPWCLFIAVYQEPVYVEAGQLFISILALLVALGFMVGLIKIRGWTLPRSSGALLILGYFGYVAQQLAIASWGSC